MNKGMITTVIFDLDGTLLDTLEDLTDAVNYAMRKHGFPEYTIPEVRNFVGNGILILMERAVPEGKNNLEFQQAYDDFRSYYGIHCNDKTKPYAGVMDLIKQLSEENYKLAIVSNKADFAVKELCDIYFKEYIHTAIGEQEEKGIKKKPAPDTVYEALKQLGSTREEALYVGDSEVDFMTAQNSGMPVVMCKWGFRDEDILRALGAHDLIDSPMELLDVLEKNRR